jgi:hypothetical protein
METTTSNKAAPAVDRAAPCSPVGRVEWQAANLHPCDGSGSTVKAWQLRVNGRVVLNAVAMTDIHEAVTAEDRKLIGQALAEYLANDQTQQPHRA